MFVADELLGYAGNGIGTTTTFVSLALARRGYDVGVLFAGAPPMTPVEPEWQRLYDEAGVRVRVVPRSGDDVRPSYFAGSRDVATVLQEDPPDVVVVQDLGAPCYAAIRLRSLGLAFETTSFVVFCHGTRQWVTDVSRKVRVLPGGHAVGLLERASVELADAVVSPSEYLVDWMRRERWQLPEKTVVIPHVSRAGATGSRPPAAPELRPVERVAFFGRLEERKGVAPFVAAVTSLGDELERVQVEFIGRPTPAWPVERVRELLSVPDVTFEPSLDQHEALDRLRRPGTLAVMPSFEENSPNVVYECLENGIPFIASNARGIRELVAVEDHERVLFEPTEAGIATALRDVLRSGDALRPARPAFDDADSLRRWDDVFAHVPARTLPPPAPLDRDEWALLLGENVAPEPRLEETLARAQQVSGADVVTCGLFVDGQIQLFPGEPRALGLLGNGYGTVALLRRSLLTDEPPWPLFAGLSVAGARIVSVPLPLATSPPLHATDDEARAVLRHFERAMPRNLRLLAELVPRLAARQERPATRPRFVRRVARRLRALTR